MHIIQYPHPTLRHKSKTIKRVDAELRRIVSAMFDLMYEARGIGLAANQVDLPLRLFVMNPSGERDSGDERVFINPVLSGHKGSADAEEGCLSLPGLYGHVTRPERVRVSAYDVRGEPIEEELTGIVSRIVQHETDHLDGVLFTDRLTETSRTAARAPLEEFELEFASRRQVGEIPSDDEIASRLAEWEARYC